MYNMIPNLNFYGFLKESEFRHNISKLNDNAKLDAIFEIFKYIIIHKFSIVFQA